MKEHGMPFCSELILALIDGRKTNTRRVVTVRNSLIDGCLVTSQRDWAELDLDKAWVDPGPSPAGNPGPYLKVPHRTEGTVHRVYSRIQDNDLIMAKEALMRGPGDVAQYVADKQFVLEKKEEYSVWRWQRDMLPSIFMPRSYTRVRRKVLAVRPERLQEISGEDAIAEGWPRTQELFPTENTNHKAQKWVRFLWNKLNAKRGYPWKNNPWVWVYGIERFEHKADN